MTGTLDGATWQVLPSTDSFLWARPWCLLESSGQGTMEPCNDVMAAPAVTDSSSLELPTTALAPVLTMCSTERTGTDLCSAVGALSALGFTRYTHSYCHTKKELTLANFKSYYKATVIDILVVQCCINIDTETTEIDSRAAMQKK